MPFYRQLPQPFHIPQLPRRLFGNKRLGNCFLCLKTITNLYKLEGLLYSISAFAGGTGESQTIALLVGRSMMFHGPHLKSLNCFHTQLIMLFKRICFFRQDNFSWCDQIINSHNLSALICFWIVMRSYIKMTEGICRDAVMHLKQLSYYFYYYWY